MPNNSVKNNIVLVGFMGAGKTTIGKLLANSLGFSFIDTDEEIEKEEGVSIAQIFEKKGEGYFRELESEFIKNFSLSKCIIATGGGMPYHKDNMAKLKVLGTVLFINTPYDSIIERLKLNQDSRPLLKSSLGNEKDELLSLFLKRQETYMSSDKIVAGDSNPSFIVEEILRIMRLGS
jgi:shikimate kinase